MKLGKSRILAIGSYFCIAVPAYSTPPLVTTQDYDIGRTGANLAETVLGPSTVSSATFGKLFSYPVDESVNAQPLYVPGLSVGGATHNVIFVATMGNTVFAFDADSAASSSKPLWQTNLGTPVPASRFPYFSGSMSHEGIFSTPVIDRSSKTIYVVAHVWNTAGQSTSTQLSALDLATGDQKFGGPVQISSATFNTIINAQRTGLLLLNGVVYVGFASHSDFNVDIATLKRSPYIGSVYAYDAQTLGLMGVFNSEPAGASGGGIWQGGRGLASDGSFVYAATGNVLANGPVAYSENIVKLNPGSASLADYFQDPNVACLNELDLDLSSSGPMIIPGTGTNLLISGAKQGKVYELLLDQTLQTQDPAYFWGTTNHLTLPAEGGVCADTRGNEHGWLQASDTAFWNKPSGASYYYSFGNYDQLMSWQVSGNSFVQASADTPASSFPNSLALSANHGTGGVLWVVAPQTGLVTTLSAYNAVPSGGHLGLLWSSTQVPDRDGLGSSGQYSVPTVVNGKLYIGSGANQIDVYGPLPESPAVQISPAKSIMTFSDGLNAVSDTLYVNSLGGYAGAVDLSLTGLPAGVSYSFSKATVTLKSNGKSVATTLTINPAAAVLPLADNYTIVIQASAAGSAVGSAPMRLNLRSAQFTAASKIACNAQNDMSASISWAIGGSSVPSVWIQDPTTPTFPGRAWVDPAAAVGTDQTGYWIDGNGFETYVYWLIDQSAGIPANFDNAIGFDDLGKIYSCP